MIEIIGLWAKKTSIILNINFTVAYTVITCLFIICHIAICNNKIFHIKGIESIGKIS